MTKSTYIEELLAKSTGPGDTRHVVRQALPAEQDVEAWVLISEHGTALQMALNCGGDDDYARVASFLVRGVPLPDAAQYLTGSYWEPACAEKNRALMAHYIDAGYFDVDDMVVVDADNAMEFYNRPHKVLSHAISTCNTVAVELLLERGAMEGAGLAEDLAASMREHLDVDVLEKVSGNALQDWFQAYVEVRWGVEAPAVMARFMEVLMRRRLETAPQSGSRARVGRGRRVV